MTAPDLEERQIPVWQKAAAVAYVLIAVGLLVAFRNRLHADFWPLDASRVSPNILATAVQVIIATPVAVLLWPPTRRRIHRFVIRHTAPLHEQFERMHEQRERHHKATLAAHRETQRHLKHIIDSHPSIPPLPSARPTTRRTK